MKKLSFGHWLSRLLILVGILCFTNAYGVTYTVSPTGYTSVPSGNKTLGSNTFHGNLIQVKATVSGSTATFTLKKSDGSKFANNGVMVLHYDSFDGTTVKSNIRYNAGIYNPSFTTDLSFTSGSKKYVVTLKSNNILYYTNPITITASAAAPTTPSSPSPSNGATNVPTSGTMSWSTSPNDGGSSISYDLYLGKTSSGMTLHKSGSGKSYSYSGLAAGQKYYWKVIVYNSSGKSTQSSTWSFTTAEAPKPNLSIGGGTYFNTNSLTLNKSYSFNIRIKNSGNASWSGSIFLKNGSTNWIEWYNVTVGAGSTVTLPTKSYTPTSTGSKQLTLYYQTGGTGTGTAIPAGSYSNPFTVTVADIPAPTTPSSPSPANGATNVPTSGTMSWSTSPNDGGSSISYDLYLGKTSSGMTLHKSGSGKSYSYSNLDPGQKYYWKVIVYNSSGKSTQSSTWSFTTAEAPKPNLSIGGGTYFNTNSLTLNKSYSFNIKIKNSGNASWSGSIFLKNGSTNWIEWYNVTVGAGSTVTLPTKSYTPTSTGSKQLTLYYQTGGTGTGTAIPAGSYSNPFTVTVADIPAPATPSSPSPANGATNIATSGTLRWSTAPNDGGSSISYDLYLGKTTSTIALYKSGSGSSYAYSNLDAGQTYFWKVIVYNSSGKSTQSPTWSFTTAKAAKPELSIGGGTYFNTNSLTLNKSYSFDIKIKNSGNASWSGSIFLKNGSTNWIEWYNVTVGAGSTVTLPTKSYTPTSTGSKELTLYYQTGGSGGGTAIPAGSYRNPFTVTVADVSAPTTPSSPSPANGATKVPTSGTMSWSTSPNDGGSSISYDLYLGKTASGMTLYKSGSGKSYSYSNLAAGQTYYWKVIVYNSSGKSTQSPTWSFTTAETAQPSQPSIAIAGGSFFGTNTLTLNAGKNFNIKVQNTGSSSWTGSFFLKCGGTNWLDWYGVTIAAGATVTLPTKTYTPTSTGKKELTLYFQTGGTGAGTPVEAGYYSNPFTVTVVEPTTTKLATPDKNTFRATDITETSFIASWGAVSGADRYDINVREVGGDYNDPVFSCGISTTSVRVSNLKAGTSYQFQIRARNGNNSQNSDWSASIPNAVTTKSSGSVVVPSFNLSIYKVTGFSGATPLVEGSTSFCSISVANKGKSTWTGNFYLKEGTTTIKKWENISIASNFGQPLEFNYTPAAAGTKALVLYYQTDGKGAETPVKNADGSNNRIAFTVSAKEVPTQADLRLWNKISCPANINLGESATVEARVKNFGTKDWEGTVFIVDGHTVLESKSVIIGPNTFCTIEKTWKPETGKVYPISIQFMTKNTTERQLVNANGFENPISFKVVGPNSPLVTSAKVTMITSGCAPEEVNEGDEVFYYYRIKDTNGQPLKDMRLRINCSGSSKISSIMSEPSDEDGYVTLRVATKDAEAFASRGEKVTFSCKDVLDKNYNSIAIVKDANNNTGFTLKLHKSNSVASALALENMESFDIVINRGVNGEAKAGKFLSGDVGLSFPFTASLKWEDGKFLTEIKSETKGKLEGTLKLGSYVEGGLGAESGLKESTTYNWSDSRRTAIALVLALSEATRSFTSSNTLRSIMALESWLGVDHSSGDGFFTPVLEKLPTTSGFWGVSGKWKIKAAKLWPFDCQVIPGNLFPELVVPTKYVEGKISFSGDLSFKCEPNIKEYDLEKKKMSYGLSRELKAKIEGNLSGFAGALSPAKTNLWNPVPENSVLLASGLYEKSVYGASYSQNWSVTTKEKEMYNNEDYTSLDKLINTFEYEAGKTFSTEKLVDYLCPDWMEFYDPKQASASASLALGTKWSWKMTSTGKFAKDLLQLSYTKPDIVGGIFPALNRDKYIIQAPLTTYVILQGNNLQNSLQMASAHFTSSYDVTEAFKLEQQQKEGLEAKLKLPIAKWGLFDITIECGFEFEATYYPTVTYYSVADKRFFPVVLRTNRTFSTAVKEGTEFLKNKIKSAFSKQDQEELTEEVKKVGKRFEFDNDGNRRELTTKGTTHQTSRSFISRRAPRLANARQNDICTFTFNLNESVNNFNDGAVIAFSHYYPAGCLLGITEQNDTLFVLSEVCDLNAIQGNDTLKAVQYGTMRLETTVGVDDLTPFGFSENQPLDVYYAEEGSDIWRYVGPAGAPINVNGLGSYMMATSIKNDKKAPMIEASMDDNSNILHIHVSDNIGTRTGSLRVYVNGEARDVFAINESSFELSLNEKDMAYMMTVYITVYDLAGNEGTLFQMFNLDKPDNVVSVETITDDDNTRILLSGKTLKVEGSKPGVVVTLFSLNGNIQTKVKTDDQGHAAIQLNKLPAGVYVVTLSNGLSKKIYIK